MKNFILPGFFEKFKINQQLIDLYKKYPEYFVDGFNFGCFYGNFGFNIWGGGRVFLSYPRGYLEDLEFIRDFYSANDIPIRLTLTNPLITEEHLYDKYANFVVETLHNGKNEILTCNTLLEQYLRKTYPNFKYCSSTTKCLTSPKEALKELDNLEYFQVCLDYNLNHNFEFLDNLTPEQKNKTEFLCNAVCPPGCPSRFEHYRLNGVSMLKGGQYYSIECPMNGNTVSENCCNYRNNISPNEIIKFETKGFKNFKLEGRSLSDSEIIANYIRYLIKPEHQIFAISQFY